MRKIRAVVFIVGVALVAACVTINVYFPAAAAEKAAEEFVDDVLGEANDGSSLIGVPGPWSETGLWAAGRLLEFFVTSAHAQQAEIDIDTPQINAIKARMAQRQRESLNALFAAGAVGFTADGFVAIRDRAAVPLNERRSLESVVADENRDRAAVYREIAVANGHPEWEQDIQKTFASQWVQGAQPGWYYQESGGAWRQK